MEEKKEQKLDLQRVDLRLVVSDDPIGEYPVKIRCLSPKHDDAIESMAVYPGSLHCFGCGFHIARRMDALAYLLYGKMDQQTVMSLIRNHELVRRYMSDSVDAYRERVAQEARRKPLNPAMATVFEEILWTEREGRLTWLQDRGLSLDTIHFAHIGHNGRRFTIPVYSGKGRLLTIRSRRDDEFGTHEWDETREKWREIPKYKGMDGRNGNYLYPEWLLAEHLTFQVDIDFFLLGKHTDKQSVHVVEGELDALLLWQQGYPALSITNGAGQMVHVPKMLKESYPLITRLIFLGDQDDIGYQACVVAMEEALRLGFEVEKRSWPLEWGKDVSELLKEHSIHEVAHVKVERLRPDRRNKPDRQIGQISSQR